MSRGGRLQKATEVPTNKMSDVNLTDWWYHPKLELHPRGQSPRSVFQLPKAQNEDQPGIPALLLLNSICSSKPTFSLTSSNTPQHLCHILYHLSVNCLNCSLLIDLLANHPRNHSAIIKVEKNVSQPDIRYQNGYCAHNNSDFGSS